MLSRRVDFSSWEVLVIIAFVVTFIGFALITWRALKMSSERREHLEQLPLEPDQPTPPDPR